MEQLWLLGEPSGGNQFIPSNHPLPGFMPAAPCHYFCADTIQGMPMPQHAEQPHCGTRRTLYAPATSAVRQKRK